MKKYNDLLMEEKPEYKALNNGLDNLTNVELISLVINRGAGTRESMEQARQIMNITDGSIRQLKLKSVYEMQVVQGIGDCKAIAILAAIEIGQRMEREAAKDIQQLNSAASIYNYIHPYIGMLDHEEAYVILMNNNYKLIKSVRLSKGGITETTVDLRMAMKEAVMNNATVLALCHNHPSNNPMSSSADDKLTRSFAKACNAMRIYFIDHVIITDGKYYSYRESGKL